MKTFSAILLASTVAFSPPAYAGHHDNALGEILGQVVGGVVEGLANQPRQEAPRTYITVTAQPDAGGACTICGPGAIYLNGAEADLVFRAIKAELKDPYSAEFKVPVGRVIAPSVGKVCTFVNAKNDFGGYTGLRMAIGTMTPGSFTLTALSGSDQEDRAIYAECARYGVFR